MQSLNNYLKDIELSISSYSLPDNPSKLYESISYILSIGGKRIRPSVVLLACDMVGGDYKKAINVAFAMELFHNFTLMHDDIMDEADVRRGMATVHKKWNVSTAILGGDAMLIKVYELLLESVDSDKLKEVLTLFNTTALEVCEGQQMDMNFEEVQQVAVADYIEMIRLKTAVLLAACFKVGAITGGANNTEADKLYAFGESLGIAFQLKDDFLDCFGNTSFGKKKGGDIIAAKKTYLTLRVLEQLEIEKREEFLQILHSKNDDKVAVVLEYYNAYNVEKETNDLMESYYNKALAIADSLLIKKENIDILKGFATDLWLRQQ